LRNICKPCALRRLRWRGVPDPLCSMSPGAGSLTRGPFNACNGR
jgi:hypothetical protein